MRAIQSRVKILSQARIKEGYWHCEFHSAQIAKAALPGQFINIKVTDNYEPLLRRPISIHGVRGARVSIFYEVVGLATQILSRKKSGDSLDIIGPLGEGFAVSGVRSAVIVAGGMGSAPLTFLAEKLMAAKSQKPKAKITVLAGARTKEKLLCVAEFKKLGCQVQTATDDGSSGFKGRVTDLLVQLVSANGYQPSTIYACGPKPMLRALCAIVNERNLPAQLSLEEHMSCGIGACLGCVVKTKDGLKRVCKDGPVFQAKDLVW